MTTSEFDLRIFLTRPSTLLVGVKDLRFDCLETQARPRRPDENVFSFLLEHANTAVDWYSCVLTAELDESLQHCLQFASSSGAVVSNFTQLQRLLFRVLSCVAPTPTTNEQNAENEQRQLEAEQAYELQMLKLRRHRSRVVGVVDETTPTAATATIVSRANRIFSIDLQIADCRQMPPMLHPTLRTFKGVEIKSTATSGDSNSNSDESFFDKPFIDIPEAGLPMLRPVKAEMVRRMINVPQAGQDDVDDDAEFYKFLTASLPNRSGNNNDNTIARDLEYAARLAAEADPNYTGPRVLCDSVTRFVLPNKQADAEVVTTAASTTARNVNETAVEVKRHVSRDLPVVYTFYGGGNDEVPRQAQFSPQRGDDFTMRYTDKFLARFMVPVEHANLLVVNQNNRQDDE